MRAATRWIVLTAVCELVCGGAAAWQERGSAVKRLYVEPFTTQNGSKELRDGMVAELRKLKGISLASEEQGADLVLGGGGEIWIKGYRSLNPRAGTSPANGTPVYAGYLSVELRGPKGGTLWSDLVTPEAAGEDAVRQIAKSVAKDVEAALARGLPSLPGAPPQPRVNLHGAGATFPYPVYNKWFANYRNANPAVEIAYEAVGSEAGVRRLVKREVDFAASDTPEAIHEIAPGDESSYLMFPSVIGAVVPIVNLPGFAGEIQFTPEALAGIYLGTIKKWDDLVLRKANPGVRLPDLDVVVVHRADGSGTSYAWSGFLSQTSAEWKSRIGTALSPKWPMGRGGIGNEGVAQTVKEFGGSIGYVEFIYALHDHLSYGKVRNRNGEFVAASLQSIEAAVARTAGGEGGLSILNAGASGAYPIASFTWLIVPIPMADAAKRDGMADFLRWMLGPGQLQAAALGYVALPKEVADHAQAQIAKLR
jgi:phosphate transport system substrate-binding protein